MIDKKLIDRINELARLSKERELTINEKNEQQELRKIYLKEFRKGFAQTLSGVKVIDEKGNDVTPKRKGEA